MVAKVTKTQKNPQRLISCGLQGNLRNAPGGGRTHNLCLRRAALYPIELPVRSDNVIDECGFQRKRMFLAE